ncbi:21390_t:CDS:2, partial [Racocetra persica]
DAVSRLQDFFKAANGGVVDDPPIKVYGQPLHYKPNGSGVKIAPDVAVYPDTAFVPKPALSTVVPRPPSNVAGNPHAQIICEVAEGQSVGYLRQKCLTWMREQYVRAVVSIKILEPRPGIREPTTGYFYRTMT